MSANYLGLDSPFCSNNAFIVANRGIDDDDFDCNQIEDSYKDEKENTGALVNP